MKKIMCLFILIISTFVFGISKEEAYNQKQLKKKEVYQKTLNYVKQNPNAKGLANLYFNLGELNASLGEYGYDPGVCAEFFKKSYELEPNIMPDVKLYNIGFFLFIAEQYKLSNERKKEPQLSANWPQNLRFTIDKVKESEKAYLKVYDDYKASKLYGEVLYRLGSLYFLVAFDDEEPVKYYNKAEYYFNELANLENDEQQVYGLFQRGWTAFTQGKWDSAINDLSKILDIIKKSDNNEYKMILESSSLEIIANSLLNYDESLNEASQAAVKLKETFAQLIDPTYMKEILDETIALKLEYSAFKQAVEFIDAYVSLYPTVKDAPVYIDSIKSIYNKHGGLMSDVTKEDVFNLYKRLVDNYNTKSVWYQANKDKNITKELKIIRFAYERVIVRYYNNAVNNISDESYKSFIDVVDNFILFPQFAEDINYLVDLENKKAGLSFLRAQKYQDSFYYFKASELMENFNKLNLENPNYDEFAKNSYMAMETGYSMLANKFENGTYVDSVTTKIYRKNEVDSLFILKANKYISYVENSKLSRSEKKEEIIRVLQQIVAVYNSENLFDYEYNTFERILTYKPEKKQKFVSYNRMAEISYEEGRFTEAALLFDEATKYSESSNDRSVVEKNKINSIVALADTLYSSSDYITAIKEYQRLINYYKKNNDTEKIIGYQNKIVEAYLNNNQPQQAIDMYVDIANEFKDVNKVLKSYAYAWNIADSTLNDPLQGVRLRREFISKYNKSNYAFKLELEIIEMYKGNPFNDKRKAMEMYLDLYKKADKMDLGNTQKSDLYIEAIKLAQGFNDENLLISMYLDFEKKNPKHPKANDFLKEVGKLYSNRGEDKEVEKIAKYLYKKDPTQNIYLDIQKNKAKDLAETVNNIYNRRSFDNRDANYDSLRVAISNFQAFASKMKKENVIIPNLSKVEQNFSDMKVFYKYCDSVDKAIKDAKNITLKTKPSSIVRVNDKTKIKTHLTGGKERYKNAVKEGLKESKKLYGIISKSEKNDATGYIPKEKQIEIVSLAADIDKMYADAILSQTEKFIKISRQFINARKSSEVTAQKYARGLIGTVKKNYIRPLLRDELIKQKLIYETFGGQYADNSRVIYAKERLTKNGLLSPEKVENYIVDETWTKKEENNLMVLSKNFEFITLPKKIVVTMPVTDNISVYYNGKQIVEKEVNDGKILFSVLAKDILSEELNRVRIVSNDFNSKVSVDVTFDEKRYNIALNTIRKEILTDFTWQTTDKLPDNYDLNDPLWKNAGEGKFNLIRAEYGQLETSRAVDIWYPEIDTTKVQDIYFLKKVNVEEGEILSTYGLVLAQNEVSIWINDKLVLDNQKLKFDNTLRVAIPYELKDIPLKNGENIILMRVKGSKKYKGVIMDIKYKLQKQ